MRKELIRKRLHEALSAEDKKALLKDKDFEDEVVRIASNVLTQLYKALWTKRAVWRAGLSNKSS